MYQYCTGMIKLCNPGVLSACYIIALIQHPYLHEFCKDIFIRSLGICTPPDLDAITGQVHLLVEPTMPLAACVTRSDTSSSIP